MRGLAYRRHQIERFKNKRKDHWGGVIFDKDQYDQQESDRMIGMCVTTPAPCSCEGCGNHDRRIYGPPINELIQPSI